MKIRKGDLVIYNEERWYRNELVEVERFSLVCATEEEWWVGRGCIDASGLILPIERILSIVKREELEEWWEFLK